MGITQRTEFTQNRFMITRKKKNKSINTEWLLLKYGANTIYDYQFFELALTLSIKFASASFFFIGSTAQFHVHADSSSVMAELQWTYEIVE